MTKKQIGLVLGVLALAGVVLAGRKLTRWGYESADYSVVRREGPFEIRDYPDLALASTLMDAERPDDGESFNRLFGYISGENQAGRKIAMTTPVFTNPTGTNRQMSFVLPRELSNQPPRANLPAVELAERPGGRFAVYRFSGGWDAERSHEAQRKLAEWVVQQNLEPLAEPQVANYDPPMMPPFLRRNEIMVRVKVTEPAQ